MPDETKRKPLTRGGGGQVPAVLESGRARHEAGLGVVARHVHAVVLQDLGVVVVRPVDSKQ